MGPHFPNLFLMKRSCGNLWHGRRLFLVWEFWGVGMGPSYAQTMCNGGGLGAVIKLTVSKPFPTCSSI